MDAPIATEATDRLKLAMSGLALASNATMIDMDGFICPSGLCSAKDGKQIVFRDDIHMTATFARSLAPELAKKLRTASFQ